MRRFLNFGSFVSSTREEITAEVPVTHQDAPDYYSIEGYSPFKAYSICGETYETLTPLMFTATHANTKKVKDLLNAHPQQLNMINAKSMSVLNLACLTFPLNCSLATIELLLQSGATFGTSLKESCDSDMTSLGLFMGAISTLPLAHPLTLIYKSKTQSRGDKIELAALLIKYGALTNISENLAIMLITGAIDTGSVVLVKQLIEGGIDVNKKWNGTDGTPLIYSIAVNKCPTVTEALIDLGADVNLSNSKGCSPFARALALGPTNGSVFVDMILTHAAPARPELFDQGQEGFQARMSDQQRTARTLLEGPL